ncbi:MAG: IgGFc-binding protein [Deltaproteobacteria bacterium]|nr:IgGFc-binding protein [Deltaproteobacteria bacterium]
MRWTLAWVTLWFGFGCGPNNRVPSGDDDGDAPAAQCTNGQTRCSGSTFETCTGGTFTTQEECAAVCAEGLGCVACNPNATVCQNGNVHACDATGQVGGEQMACTGSNVCEGGACVDACVNAAMNKSYQGCEYWAVDLDNAIEVLGTQGSLLCDPLFGVPGAKNVNNLNVCANANNSQVAGLCDPPGNACPSGFTCKVAPVCILDAQNSPFAIVVSNPQTRTVNVTITSPTGTTNTQSVAAGQVVAIKPQSAPLNIPDQSIDGSGTARKAYKVTSDLPIVAYQFNPLDNVNVFSNDASLLIPRTAFDVEYYTFAWPTEDRRTPAPGSNNYHGYLSVVAWQDNTVVEVTTTAATVPGPAQPAIAANTPTQFTLNAHDVLTLESVPGGDLTGSKVRAVDGVQTFGVFGGHEAMGFGEMQGPAGFTRGPCCADHIEEMMFPTSTWGKTFAIARSKSRGTNEPDLIRVMAQKPNTTVTFDPAPASGSCGTLQPGGFCEVKIQGDTSIIASEPVLVAHYLESAIWSNGVNSVGEGDPSFAIAVPVEQFRKDYTVLVPQAYAKNFMSISAPANGLVQVDGLSVQLTPYGNGTYRAARHQVTPGQHKINCPSGCGVEIYGYSDAVSYMFAGGLDLAQIVLQ